MSPVRSMPVATAVILSMAFAAIAAEPVKPDVQRKGDIWSVVVDGVDVNFRIPAHRKALRGVLLKPADTNVTDPQNAWTAAVASWGFGECGMLLRDMNRGNRPRILSEAFRKALSLVAEASGHPELPRLPFVATGFSKGGGWARDLSRLNPDRAIGYVNVCCWMGGDLAKVPPEYLGIPGLYILGSVPDGFQMLPTIEAEYVPAMQRGRVLWTCALSWGAAHDWLPPTTPYAVTYLDQVVRMRLPAESPAAGTPPALREMKWEEGWMGDRSTWDAPCPSIASFADYTGTRENASWQPNRYLAHVWRAYMTRTPEVTFAGIAADSLILENPGRAEYGVASDTRLTITAQLKDGVEARSVSFYDGDVPLGHVASKPYTFAWHRVPAGNHAVIAVANLANEGGLRSSPILWVAGVPEPDR